MNDAFRVSRTFVPKNKKAEYASQLYVTPYPSEEEEAMHARGGWEPYEFATAYTNRPLEQGAILDLLCYETNPEIVDLYWHLD